MAAPAVACSVAAHAAMKRDERVWAELAYVGVQRTEADETGPAEVYEVRNCACGSTLYRKIEVR